MIRKMTSVTAACLLVLAAALPGFAQGSRGKAEMKSGAATVTIDYGRPSLKGRDMLGQLPVGDFWRMGSNQATTMKASADLTFGATKVAKGNYSLWLKRASADKYELVFNSQTGQWGTDHDASKDVVSVPLSKSATGSPVETFTIDLKESGQGGSFILSWGTTKLTGDFTLGK